MLNAVMCFDVNHDPDNDDIVTFCSKPVNTVMLYDPVDAIEKAVQEGRLKIYQHPEDPRQDKYICGICGREMHKTHCSC